MNARLYQSDIKPEDREYLFREASARTGLPAYVIEKDYVVSLVLTLLFSEIKDLYTDRYETPFLFKGGTSLSKVYGVIDRMSEDIDLSVHMNFLGFPEPENYESKSARKRRVEKLLKSNFVFITDLVKILKDRLQVIHSRFEIKIDPEQAQNIIIEYPCSLSETDYSYEYIKPHVLLETGGRASFDPFENKKISPIMSPEILKNLTVDNDCCALVDVLSIKRTFFEKLTLLHEIIKRGPDKLAPRQSRHLSDLIQIYSSFPKIINDYGLLENVRNHKEKYFSRAASKWELAVPGTISIIPTSEIEEKLKSDWDKMADMFPGATLPYDFNFIMTQLKNFDSIINA